MNLKEPILNQKRFRIRFKGIVQGVGFRPFIYRIAQKCRLTGFVKNTPQGVILEVEGDDIDTFIQYVITHKPPLSIIDNYDIRELPLKFYSRFDIKPSEESTQLDLLVPPDIAICDNCKNELLSHENRRHGYPFINCTDCGPRFTIIRDLPYDRPKTTMNHFTMCEPCSHEYMNPLDRRFHAQPISCFGCGPAFHLNGELKKDLADTIENISAHVKEGQVIAIKGIGGYHLSCRAFSDDAVLKLREFKKREQKPFALMGTLEMIRQHCWISEMEKNILLSTAAPILLLKKKRGSAISKHVAPGQNHIGFMAPYTPLHLMLIDNVGEPLVMTSANFSDEPIIYKDDICTLSKLSNFVLSHNRKIHIFADDSVARVFENQIFMIRRSRGYVPLPIILSLNTSKSILGLGGMLKTTFTFFHHQKALVSQYIGNTDSPRAIEAERFAIDHFMKLFSLNPDKIAIDKHPGYPNRKIAQDFKNAEVVEIQHHKAHIGSLLAEKNVMDQIIGISMDGTGYGDDGNIWGGEFFIGDYKKLVRFGHLKYLFLPSGEKSIREPWRFALSVLYSLYGHSKVVQKYAEHFGREGQLVLEVIEKKIGGIFTSSCGRLFDAVASICGIGNLNTYEGELPSLLQAIAERCRTGYDSYEFSIEKGGKCMILNFLPTIHDIILDKRQLSHKAFIFHRTVAKAFVNMVELASDAFKIKKVGLSGGVFQNILLLQMTKNLLEERGFEVLIHSKIPANDGGISLGQVFLAAGKL